MSLQGVVIGAMAFITIGVFHPIVIKAEYHFGARIWPAFLILGIVALGLSMFVENVVGGAMLGILGFSALWSIKEVFEQAKRVERGWFPKNPKREY